MTANFRPFDERDWEAFAGCETDSPLIAEFDETTIIIDGRTVQVLHDGLVYSREFPDEQLARDFAELAAHVTRHETFELLFGESIGGYGNQLSNTYPG